ncbi:rho guanine nucleotide exchange factor 26 [Ambystoma mexicanum]|uniref:rho guanine nucleotide exchange factor 26 n=1 Tax=Ambystoma mexicanum TaxID=8296 RepID=UPI0037E9A0A9
MDGRCEVDFTNNNVRLVPMWRRSTARNPLEEGVIRSLTSKPRPQSYQSPEGVLMTDFPLEDRGTFTVTQPAEKVLTSPDNRRHRRGPFHSSSSLGSLPNGRSPPSSPEGTLGSPQHVFTPPLQRLKVVSNNSISFTANGSSCSPDHRLARSRRVSNRSTLTSEPEQIVFSSSPSPLPNGTISSTENNNHNDVHSIHVFSDQETSYHLSPVSRKTYPDYKTDLQRSQSNPIPMTEKQSFGLSTNSAAAHKVGVHQIIPMGLASGTKVTNKVNGQNNLNGEAGHRTCKARSMVETSSSLPLVASPDRDTDPDSDFDNLCMMRRGLRSTSYRRAVVSGIDFSGSSEVKKNSRMSQPNLKAVVEDKEKFSSLGRLKLRKKRTLKGKGTFGREETAVLYQNYKEKALDIDSDEEADCREGKSDERIVIQYRPLRASWSQLSAVKRKGLSQAVSQEEKKRQEAIFEVISSEHSYLLSLDILIKMFKNSKALSTTMTKTESHHLFSNIADVSEASKKFFKELESRHQKNILIEDISDIVEKHAKSTFDPYVKYCTNEVYQQRTLQKLLSTNSSFKEVLSGIETNEACRNLPMISFLILPMQRVTRLPLLMDTICQKTAKDSPKYEACKQALKEVSKLVRLCNEGARKMERTEMMYTINSQLEFKIKPFPLVSSSRWLRKRGELTAYVEDTGIFSKRTSRQQFYLFLFNDVLIITKKRSDESYNVTDYSLREQLSVAPYENEEISMSPGRSSTPMLYSRQTSANFLFKLTILNNYAGEEVEILLGAETLNERARWITALGQGNDRTDTDRTNLTQVEIIRSCTAKQPDELSLQVADVVLVYQKVNDGWYEGERLRDGERGWFPMECAKEITCRATIEKNMERMGRLLGLETNV